MRKINFLIIILVSVQSFGQISGKVTDGNTGLPIEFVNIWIKNTLRGTTTDSKGNFKFENAKVGETLLISYLGYEEFEFQAKEENQIKLQPKDIELDEVVVIRMKNEKIQSINSYKKYKEIIEFYYNGHYSLARFYEYKNEYENNPLVKKISLVVNNAKKEKVKFRIHLIKADNEGKPSNQILSDYYVLNADKGRNEVSVDLTIEKLLFPKNGLFVVVDRLNLKENKYSNRLAKDILQPAIGIGIHDQKKNTWLGYSGKWVAPSELTKFAGNYKNIAVNIELTD
jgi:carboxypeptidase-like protein